MDKQIKLYSTLSRTIENFKPIKKNEVSLYACGVTTYDDAHLGHARQAIFFDIVRKYFEHLGCKVIYVRNYTDIDDKIIDKAIKLKREPLELSNYYVTKTEEVLKAIKVDNATYEPKVTDHIKDIISFIETLIKNGNAYVVGGEVLFDVYTFPQYGKLSGRKLEELINNDTAGFKKHPQDFSLWKKAKEMEPSWLSPWGLGRPGWHIECSALVKVYLGDCIDIHGGGIDLIFPHHENEIAQSESLTKKNLANYWLHNGLVMVEGQKMSKSLGNFVTIEQVLRKYSPDVIRFAMLSAHFSSPLDFTDDLLKISSKRVYYFYKVLKSINKIIGSNNPSSGNNFLKNLSDNIIVNFELAMNDNLNTPMVIAQLSSCFLEVNKFLKDTEISVQDKIVSLKYFLAQFSKMTKVIKILDENPEQYINKVKSLFLTTQNLTEEDIQSKIQLRDKAKAEKDFALSDSIRQKLKDKGIELHDTRTETCWDIF